jgi:uncharacterized protein (TIGR02391 family)
MNLQTHIRAQLWLAISNTYQAENYSHAILDAMHYLSNILREKTGVDGDGVNLVGQALSGDSPRLRLNKLQTETERNTQKGLEHILRGMYWAIRNPRSHEQAEDTKDTADAIIYFIDYLLSILDQSVEPFTLSKFLERVFDPDFVSSERYAELLAGEIPANKRLDTLIEIYRQRGDGNGRKLGYTVRAILKRLTQEQVTQFLAVVSDELKRTQDEQSARSTIQMLPPKLWTEISEVARLRIENKLIRSIQEGQAYPNSEKVRGAFGTWARYLLQFFTLREQVGHVLLEELEGKDENGRLYVAKFFLDVLPKIITDKWQTQRVIIAISKAIRNNEFAVRQCLIDSIWDYTEEWQKGLVEELKDLTDPEHPLAFFPDGTPFLKQDDIPF